MFPYKFIFCIIWRVQINRICNFILSVCFVFYILRIVSLYCIFSYANRWYNCIYFLVTSIVHCVVLLLNLAFFDLTLHSQDLALSEEIVFALIVALRQSGNDLVFYFHFLFEKQNFIFDANYVLSWYCYQFVFTFQRCTFWWILTQKFFHDQFL